jgi:hypothetical protein
MQKPVKTAVWAVVAIVLGYFFLHFIFVGPKVVPQEFAEARRKIAVLGSEIGALSNEAVSRLDDIRKLDKEFDYEGALILINAELIKNRALGDKAVSLSNELANLARSLISVRPASARELASEAIGYEVAMVSRLISYNNVLKELFELLRLKYTWRAFDVDEKVNELVDEINSGARAINSYNEAANASLAKFDEVIK